MTVREGEATIEAHVVYAGHLFIKITSPIRIDLDIERSGCYSPFIGFGSEEAIRRYAEQRIRKAYRQHMNIADEDDTFLLMDGTRLEGVRREHPQELKWPSSNVQGAACELFARNAHFLLAHAKRILSDSRLFLTPVWIQSGMAYAGPLKMPCLGGYIEWWLNSPCAVMGEGEERALTYFISGSPLSGTNVSSCVRADGERVRSKNSLLALANSFNRTMERYTQARCRFQSYTLEEALGVLKGGQPACEDSVERIALEQRVRSQDCEIERLKTSVAHQEKLIKAYTAALSRAVVREQPDDVRRAIAQADAARAGMSTTENKGVANRPVEMLFQSFAKREGVVLCAPSRRFLLEELARQSGTSMAVPAQPAHLDGVGGEGRP